ncbi:MAG: FISUMP domain-containing protein [Bacteroidales bacterium]
MMRQVVLQMLVFFLILPFGLSGQNHATKPGSHSPSVTPVLNGPNPACAGSTGNFYSTDPGQTGYVWSISTGGNITSGLGTANIQVTWLTGYPSNQTLSVSFTNSTITTLDVTVNPSLPVSVSITASENPVCAGTPVTYTTTPVNGGTDPHYQWQVNGINIAGATNGQYTYVPANNNQVTCILTSNEPCTTGNQVVSNIVVMTVNPILPASVSISASANPACASAVVTYTATAFNGGTAPVYQWRLNNTDIAAATNSTCSLVPANLDKITCVMMSNSPCVNTNQVTSNEINMTVSSNLPVSVSIVASEIITCPDHLVDFTAISVNGGSLPIYNWLVNGVSSGINSPVYSYTPTQGDQVTCVLTSSAGCTEGNPATSNELTITVANYSPVSLTINPSANPSCNGVPVTFTANAINGGTTPVFQWLVNGATVGATNAAYTYTPTDADIISCVVNSNAWCATGNPAVSNVVNMTVSSSGTPAVSIVSSGNVTCQGTLVTFTATPQNGGVSPVYQWKVNGVDAGTSSPLFAYVPVNGDLVTCNMTSNSLCSSGVPVISNTITMSVSPIQTVGISISTPSTLVCQGSTVSFLATGINGGTNPVYQWKVNGANAGANSPGFSYVPVDTDVITCTLQSNATCAIGNPATSTPVIMTVSASLPAGVSIIASASPACTGIPVLFSATAVNGGTNPVYEWWVNNVKIAGETGSTFSYTSNADYTVKCILISNNGCPTPNTATSNVIVMSVSQVIPVSVTLVSSEDPSCLTAFITLTATPVNGGTNPVYQWKVNNVVKPGETGPTYTYAPANGDLVTCLMTSSDQCTSGNPASASLTLNVQTILSPSIFVTTPEPIVCPGTMVAFTANTTNPGSDPIYQWYLNGVASGPNNAVFNLIPNDGDKVKCRLTSSLLCVTGNPVTSAEYTIHTNSPLPGAITINASANPFCQGSLVSFTASIVNGGSTPLYKWRVNGILVGTLSTYSYNPVNGDYVTCQLTSSLSCSTGPVTSNPILMQVKTQVPASVTIAASENPVCTGNSVTFTAIPVNGGSTPVFLWKVNGVPSGSGSTFTYIPLPGDVVTCTLTSNATCVSGSPVTSAPVTMVVSSGLPASVNIVTGTNPFCAGTSVTFNALVSNGGTAPLYQWQINGSNYGTPTVSPFLVYSPVNGTVVSCILTSNSTCLNPPGPVLSNQIIMTEAANLPAGISITPSVNPSCQGTAVTFTANAVNGGIIPEYQWKVGGVNVASATNASYTFVPANGNLITCQLTSSLTCASGNPAISNTISMGVTSTIFPSVSIVPSVNPACAGTTVTFTATVNNEGTTPVFTWRVNGLVVAGATNSTYSYQPLNYDAVTCMLQSDALCNSGIPVISNQVAMVINAEKTVGVNITTPSLSFCAGTPVTYTATAINGGSSPTYQWKVNGLNGAGASTNATYTYTPLNGDIITCELTSNLTCIVASSNPATSNSLVMTTGILVPSVTITSNYNNVCPETSVTFTAIAVNGGTSPVYQWRKNGVSVGYNQNTYEVAPVNGDQVTCIITSNLSCILGSTATSNTITTTVLPAEPLTVVVTTSANPSCLGSTVCYFAAVQNGGDYARYRWKVNGQVQSSLLNNPTYCYVPVNNDSVSCLVVSSATCPTPNPRNSNKINMVVFPITTPTVTVSAPGNLVCEGTAVTFTATPANGGNSPAFQWKVNLANVAGATNSTYSYVPLNSDQIINEMTSNASCVSTNVATSSPYPVSVSPNVPVSLSIVSVTNPVCQGSTATFIATPIHGGSIPSYQWMVNGSNAGGNSAFFSYVPANGDLVTCRLTSNDACPAGNPALSNTIEVTVVPTSPVSVSILASATPACQGQSITYSATATNGGVSPIFQWLVNGMMVGSNLPAYSYVPSSGDVVTCHLTSDITCPTGNPALSNPISMIFPSYLPVSVSIACSGNPACQGTPSTFIATPVNGGGTPAYQWKNKGIDIPGATDPTYGYMPLTDDVITCVLASSETCVLNNPAISNSVTMSVLELRDPSVTIVPSVNPACQGNEVTFTATPVNGGSSPVYHWFKNGVDLGAGQQTYTYTPTFGDEVSCQLTTSLTCFTQNTAVSNTVIMDVELFITPSVSITASPFPACDNQQVVFTATAQNTGLNPVFQWVVNGLNVGSNSQVFNYLPTAGDKVSCQLASSYSCATSGTVTSNEITMVVNPVLPVSLLISCSSNPVCQGESVTFSSTPVNGGTNPGYQWQNKGVDMVGATNSTLTYIPASADLITCVMTSGEMCVLNSQATSNAILMLVASQFDVSVAIATLDNPACVGTEVLFTATPFSGGNSPTYKWFVDGVEQPGAVGATFSCFPIDGAVVKCVMTSQFSCGIPNPATSNLITMEILGTPVSILTTAVPSGPVCAGTVVTYTAIPTNGGTGPTFEWNINGVPVPNTNNPVFLYAPSDLDEITCTLNSNATCIIGNTVTSDPPIVAHVFPNLPVSVNVSATGGTTVCAGSEIVFTATPVNGGTLPVYQWKVNGTDYPGATNSIFNYTPVDGDAVSCLLSSNATCPTGTPAMSNILDITVNPLLPVSISVSASANTVCAGTMVNFAAVPTNGGTGPAYQWQINGIDDPGATNSTFNYIPVNGDAVSCILTSNATCPTGTPANSNSLTVAVNPLLVVSVSASASATTVCAGSQVTFTATPTNGGTVPAYQWRLNGTDYPGATNSTFSLVPANGDAVLCVLTSNATCPTGTPATSNTITISVNPLLPVSISVAASATTICAGAQVDFTATPVNGGIVPGYQWKVNGLDYPGATNSTFNYTPVNGDAVFCLLSSNATCPAGTPAMSNILDIMVNPLLPVSVSISASAITVCAGTMVNFTAIPANGGTGPAYQWQLNGIDDPGATNSTFNYVPVNGDVVSCVLISNATCPTGTPATSNSIMVVVNPLLAVSVSVSATATTVCAGSQVTFTATPTNGGTIPAYQWRLNGTDFPGATNSTFSLVPANGDAVLCVLSSNATCPTGTPATSNTITISVNPLLPVSISVAASATTICMGAMVDFTATPVNGGAGPAYQWKVNGTDYPGATNSTFSYTPVNGDAVSCQLTSNATCATGTPALSNISDITVNPVLPVSVSISASANTVCAGTTVNFTAFPTNGGTGPAYQWRLNGVDYPGATNAVFNYIPVNGDAISCVLASSATCPTGTPATSNSITVMVNPLLAVSVSASASATTVCAGSQVTFTATPTNGGTVPAYQWRLNGTDFPGATNSTFSLVPANGDAVFCVLTSNATCPTGTPATSNTITIIVNPLLPVSVSVAASSTTVCAGVQVDFTATPVNGGTGPVYQWKVNGTDYPGATSSLFSYIPVNGDAISCLVTSDATCATGSPAISNSLSITVNPVFSVGVGITANPPGLVCAGLPVTFTATPVNGGLLPVFQWKVNGMVVGTNSNVYTYQPSVNDLVVCSLTSDLTCTSGNPAIASVQANVSPVPVVTYSACHDVETAVNARPFKLRGGLPLGGVYSGNGVNSITGIFDPAVAGPGLHVITYTVTTAGLCVVSNSLAVNNHNALPVNCAGATFTDIRDNQVYPIVKIGTQCWFATNLNYGTRKSSTSPQLDNCVNDKYCMGNADANCSLYGGFYQWDELMRHDPAFAGHQGLCPPGWHVPSDAEWVTLFNFYGGQSVSGSLLMDQSNGSFKVQPAGVYYQDQLNWSFTQPGITATFFWTADPVGQWRAKSHGLNNQVNSVSDYDSGRGNGFSVRCIQD